MCLHKSTAAEQETALFDLFYENPEDSNLAGLVGASAGHGGTRLFVINGTVVGKHKIKRLSETLPCLFSHLVS